MLGFAFSNAATRSVQVFSAAAWSGVGFCPTLIVTVASALVPPASDPDEQAVAARIIKAAAAAARRRVVNTRFS
jgi:hypothetical protein